MSLSKENPLLSASVISTPIRSFFDSLEVIHDSKVDRIHVDVMDGQFVPRFGLYPELLWEIRQKTSLPIDVHMMVMNPEDYIDVFAKAGASRLVPHVEPVFHLDRLIGRIVDSGLEAGVALNPQTDVSSVQFVLNKVHSVTLMGINPGIVGHKLIPEMLQKLRRTVNYLGNESFRGILEVDGGVTFENFIELVENGAESLVVGAGTLFHPDAEVNDNAARLNQMRQA